MNNDEHKIDDVLSKIGDVFSKLFYYASNFVSLLVVGIFMGALIFTTIMPSSNNNATTQLEDKKELEVKQVNTEEIVGYVIADNDYYNFNLGNVLQASSSENFSAVITVCYVYTEGEKEQYKCINMDVNDLTAYFDYMSTAYKLRTVYKETTVYEDDSETTVYRLGDLIE